MHRSKGNCKRKTQHNTKNKQRKGNTEENQQKQSHALYDDDDNNDDFDLDSIADSSWS